MAKSNVDDNLVLALDVIRKQNQKLLDLTNYIEDLRKLYKELDVNTRDLINLSCHGGDFEANHQTADDIIIDLLVKLGFDSTAHAWRNVKPKYYA